MFGSDHEGYDHPDQLLLLGSEAGTVHGRSTVRLLVGRGEAGSNPNELIRQLVIKATKVAYP